MSNTLKMPSRAPALYLLLGIIGGLFTAQFFEAPFLATLSISAGLALLSLFTARRDGSVWLFCFLSATLLTAWNYGTLHSPEKPSEQELTRPAREAQLQLQITRILQERSIFGDVSGIGSIVSADEMSRLRPKQPIFFRLKLRDSDHLTLLAGSKIEATGVLSPIESSSETNGFDQHLQRLGISYRFERLSALSVIDEPDVFQVFCHNMNLQFRDFLKKGAPDGQFGGLSQIYAAMLLGQKNQLNSEQKERFRKTGTMHFFAISGLHIGVIATVIAQFLALIRLPKKLSPLIGLPLLFLYVEITGAPPSAVRAFLMALFFWMSFAFSRQRSPIAALAASAVFVLIISPEQIWSIGFQLSYLVVLSIILFGLPLNTWLVEALAPFRYLPKASWSRSQRLYVWAQNNLILLFSISCAAWLASAPLSASFFGFFSPGAILLNMLLVNLAALAISTGVMTLFICTIGLEIFAGFLNHAAWLSIYLMDQLVKTSAQMPAMLVHCKGFSPSISYSTLSAYFALLIWINQKPLQIRRGFILLLPPSLIIAGLFIGIDRLG